MLEKTLWRTLLSLPALEKLSRLNEVGGDSSLAPMSAPSAALSRLEPSASRTYEYGPVSDSSSVSAPGDGFSGNFLNSFASNFDAPGAGATHHGDAPGAGASRHADAAGASSRADAPGAGRSGRSRRSSRSRRTQGARRTHPAARSSRSQSAARSSRASSGQAPRGTFRSRGTGYYPHNSRMEGGYTDRRGNKLNTLQDYLAGKAPFVSVAMDKNMKIPYGTKLRIKELEQKYGRPIEFRVVDTGGAFTGRGTGRIDICTANAAASRDATINGPLTLDFG